MKRVLIITYYWPPSGGSGVQRWVKFAKYLPSEGWQPVIYTPSNPSAPSIDESLLSDIPPEAEIIKRPIREIYGLYRRIMGKNSSTDIKTLLDDGGKKSLSKRISLALRANLFIPDPRVSWVRPSVKFLTEYLREHPVDAIVTTGPPHSVHLIGKALSKKLALPWIPDFRDPWCKMYYLKHIGMGEYATRKQRRLEQQVLDSASAVLTVTPSVQSDYAKMTNTPVEMVTNGYDEDDFRCCVEPDGFFNLVHTGLFTAGSESLAIWKVLSDKCAESEEFRKALRIRVVGKRNSLMEECFKANGLDSNVLSLGYLPHPDAVKEQKKASVLLLTLAPDPGHKPILSGKLFEYLAARKPILSFGYPDGATALLLEETGGGSNFLWQDYDGTKAFIDEKWEAFCRGEVLETKGNIEKYSRRELTGRLAHILDDIVCKAKN